MSPSSGWFPALRGAVETLQGEAPPFGAVQSSACGRGGEGLDTDHHRMLLSLGRQVTLQGLGTIASLYVEDGQYRQACCADTATS